MAQAQEQRGPASAMLVVACALVDAQGRVLMQRRPEGREHAGLWEFPGGKVEAGEGPTMALARELAEELAISVATETLVPLGFSASDECSGARPVVLLLYGCRRWRGTAISQEAARIDWFDPKALDALPMPPLDVPLVPLATQFAGTSR